MDEALRACTKCNESKPLTAFYKHPYAARGRDTKCMECAKRSVRLNRAAKLEYYREFDRQRANDPRRVVARKLYAATPAGKAAGDAAKVRWSHSHPNEKRAHAAVGNALRDGILTRKPCEVCGVSDHVEAHHDDYTKPLDVRWLCDPHHKEHHKALRAAKRKERAA
jgi:hypothetical protein